MHRSFKNLSLATSLATTLLFAAPHHASAATIVTNGTFTGTVGQIAPGGGGSATGWTAKGNEGVFGPSNTPTVFVFASNAGQTGETGDAYTGTVKFYGVSNSPDGQNFIAAAGDSNYASIIQQTLTGLTVGDVYDLTFNWAGAQQQGFSGATTEYWNVTFGTTTQKTATVSTPSQSFAGWKTADMTFTAAASTQLLSFAAKGAADTLQPWLLLDNVAIVDKSTAVPTAATPEPSSLILLGTGLLGFAGAARRRFLKA